MLNKNKPKREHARSLSNIPRTAQIPSACHELVIKAAWHRALVHE